MIVAIDFDGTIIKAGCFPELGPVRLLADEVIRQWHTDGVIILINTCRSGKYEGDAVTLLESHKIPFDYINSNHPDSIIPYKTDCRKLAADIYIDDRQVGGLPTWTEIDMLVRNHVNYPPIKN